MQQKLESRCLKRVEDMDNKTAEERENIVIEHIKLFKVVESHYVRREANLNIYQVN